MTMMLRFLMLIIFLIFPVLIVANISSTVDHWYFPPQEITLGFYDNDFMPRKMPHPPHPFFWTSRTRASGGATFIYQWIKYHTSKYFSVNLAVSLSDWVIHADSQVAASFFFVVRVWLFRTNTFSPYFDWSIAGPTLLSLRKFSQANLGERFIFQDFMGLGAMIGGEHHFDVSVNLYHYSNGDLFVHNDGWDVPLIVSVGYMFDSI